MAQVVTGAVGRGERGGSGGGGGAERRGPGVLEQREDMQRPGPLGEGVLVLDRPHRQRLAASARQERGGRAALSDGHVLSGLGQKLGAELSGRRGRLLAGLAPRLLLLWRLLLFRVRTLLGGLGFSVGRLNTLRRGKVVGLVAVVLRVQSAPSRCGGGGGGRRYVVVENAVGVVAVGSGGVGVVGVVAMATLAVPACREEQLSSVVVVVRHVCLASKKGSLFGGGKGGRGEEGGTGPLKW